MITANAASSRRVPRRCCTPCRVMSCSPTQPCRRSRMRRTFCIEANTTKSQILAGGGHSRKGATCPMGLKSGRKAGGLAGQGLAPGRTTRPTARRRGIGCERRSWGARRGRRRMRVRHLSFVARLTAAACRTRGLRKKRGSGGATSDHVASLDSRNGMNTWHSGKPGSASRCRYPLSDAR